MNIKWFFHVSNGKVIMRASTKSIKSFISTAGLRWYGHLVRMPESRLDWKPNHGKRSISKNRRAGELEAVANFRDLNNNKVQDTASPTTRRDVC